MLPYVHALHLIKIYSTQYYMYNNYAAMYMHNVQLYICTYVAMYVRTFRIILDMTTTAISQRLV